MTLGELYRTKSVWLIEHVVVIGVPVAAALVYFRRDPLLQYGLFAVCVAYMAAIAATHGATLGSVGLTARHFRDALSVVAGPSLLAAGLIVAGKLVVPQAYLTLPQSGAATLLYVLVSVPLQELLFRGFCLWRCRLSFRSHALVVVLNSLNFASIHIVFGNWWFVLGVFLLNLFWSHAFMRAPNLFVFMLSHALLGTLYFLPLPR
jgi:membrane protease YdiL (CAAX protease family)